MQKIEVKGLVKKYGKTLAVDHLSFAVEAGEVLSLLGPSGCGKTTALRAVAGLEQINEGEIYLNGKLVTAPAQKIFVSPEKRNLGLVFQTYALWPHMTVYENVAYGLKTRKTPKPEVRDKVSKSLQLVGLSGLESRYPSQLSGGQQQRVSLARNLAYEPDIILLDEPLSNLDLKERERMRGEIQNLLKSLRITAIYVTHDQEEAFVISDRVILMKDGKKIQEAKPSEIYEHPANLFVAEFIGRANIFKAQVTGIKEKEHLATVSIPDMSTSLVCKYDCDLAKENTSLICIRQNEIHLYESKPSLSQNVVEGEVVSREYRGAITDHRVSVGNAQLTVTTHKFCSLAEGKALDKKKVYLHIPPESIKLIRC